MWALGRAKADELCETIAWHLLVLRSCSYGRGLQACVRERTALISFTRAVAVQKGFQPCLKEYSREPVLKNNYKAPWVRTYLLWVNMQAQLALCYFCFPLP